jgi:GT2 family glycosyltransferase
MRHPSISLCLPTLNRGSAVLDLLSLISHLQEKPDEIIVCDQSDEPLEISSDLRSNLPPVIYQHVEFRSLTRARNSCIALASCEIYCFLDDDSEPYAEYFKTLRTVFQCLQPDAVFGSVTEVNTSRLHRTSIPNSKIPLYDQYRLFDSTSLQPQYPVGLLKGNNFALSATSYRATGPFDEHFLGVAHREETDYAFRLMKGGFTIAYWPSLNIVHFDLSTGGCRPSQQGSESEALCRLYFAFKHFNNLSFSSFLNEIKGAISTLIQTNGRSRIIHVITRFTLLVRLAFVQSRFQDTFPK